MLAYSSIAHAGYILVALTADSTPGSAAAMFYLAAYAFTNLGAFAVVTYFSRKGERYVAIDDFAGLSQRQPAMAAMLTIFLLSLIGVPLTAGFFGKFFVGLPEIFHFGNIHIIKLRDMRDIHPVTMQRGGAEFLNAG